MHFLPHPTGQQNKFILHSLSLKQLFLVNSHVPIMLVVFGHLGDITVLLKIGSLHTLPHPLKHLKVFQII